MTLTVNATVTEIEPADEDGNSMVTLTATAGETATMNNRYDNTDHEYVVNQISSNTEGNVLAAKIILVIEGEEAPLEIGQVVEFSASFSKKQPTA